MSAQWISAMTWQRTFSGLKHVVFWAGACASSVVSAFGAVILLWVVTTIVFAGSDRGAWIAELWGIASYIGSAGLKGVKSSPSIVVLTVFWIGVYVAAMVYFAQTRLEKRICKWLVPSTLLALPLCAIYGATLALAGLASQGAGH